MIAEWFLGLASTFVKWLSSVFGEWEAPPEFEQARDAMAGLLGNFASVGVWVDWAVLGVCVAVSLASWGVVLAIKLVRAIVAHIPAFGGSGD